MCMQGHERMKNHVQYLQAYNKNISIIYPAFISNKLYILNVRCSPVHQYFQLCVGIGVSLPKICLEIIHCIVFD